MYFREIPGYEKRYSISKSGVIKSLSKRGKTCTVKKTGVSKWGYERTTLWNGVKNVNHKVHRLVAITYMKNPQKHGDINHIDGDKLNNNLDNLEYCSRSENMKHAYKTGLKIHWRKQEQDYVF